MGLPRLTCISNLHVPFYLYFNFIIQLQNYFILTHAVLEYSLNPLSVECSLARSSSTSSAESSRSVKKSFYSKLKKEEEERDAEWAEKYRDRVSHKC